MASQQRPLVVSIDRLHQITQRREETKLARYDLLVGSVSRLITRSVQMDPKRTSIFVPLGSLMGREFTAPGVDVVVGLEYVVKVLLRNGYAAVHIGDGVLLVSWPDAPQSAKLRQMNECVDRADSVPARQDGTASAQRAFDRGATALANDGRSHPTSAQVEEARDTLSNIRRIVARYKR